MNSSAESSIYNLAALTTVNNYGDIRYVIAPFQHSQFAMLVLTLTFGRQYCFNPRLLDTLRIRASSSPQQSGVRTQKYMKSPGQLS